MQVVSKLESGSRADCPRVDQQAARSSIGRRTESRSQQYLAATAIHAVVLKVGPVPLNLMRADV